MTTHRIGYSRVSTLDQDPSSQQDALERAGVDRVFVEHFSGTRASRPGWDRAREQLRAGDTLVVTRLDRLGRSTKDLLEISQWLEAGRIELQVLEQPIDTRSPEGRMFFTILAAFAQFERDLIVARTKDGLAAAKARGRTGGRRPKLTPQKMTHIVERHGSGESVTSLAAYFGVSRQTIYRTLDGAANG
ncbi:recombinase family protein [Pseudolysinimonas sp.]|uniref:recombinase family protein n=1 Tax=Pseudolysinimonas sp. TaxID=2680009 RepID=UPI003F7D246F